jgi:DNA ligase-associated metallophosphoesterase
MSQQHEILFGGQTFIARADRSLWWPEQKVLFIADVHAGKATHFQRAGLRMPIGNFQADLQRLQTAIDELQPKRVIVLGDLFHSDQNAELSILHMFIAQLECTFELVRGNHDRFIDDATFVKHGIIVHPENYMVDSLVLRHHPSTDANQQYVLCGHVHPIYRFHSGGDSFRLPSFIIDRQQIILPAYGSITGGYAMHKQTGRTIIGTAPDFGELLYI